MKLYILVGRFESFGEKKYQESLIIREVTEKPKTYVCDGRRYSKDMIDVIEKRHFDARVMTLDESKLPEMREQIKSYFKTSLQQKVDEASAKLKVLDEHSFETQLKITNVEW